VTENHGLLDNKLANCTMGVVMDIGTTDTSLLDLDFNVMRVLDFGNGTVLKGNVVDLVEKERRVGGHD